jgi:hypothetical protein
MALLKDKNFSIILLLIQKNCGDLSHPFFEINKKGGPDGTDDW